MIRFAALVAATTILLFAASLRAEPLQVEIGTNCAQKEGCLQRATEPSKGTADNNLSAADKLNRADASTKSGECKMDDDGKKCGCGNDGRCAGVCYKGRCDPDR
jgi:hypothetical protein